MVDPEGIVALQMVSAKFVLVSDELPQLMNPASLPGAQRPLPDVWLLVLLQMSPVPEPAAETVSV